MLRNKRFRVQISRVLCFISICDLFTDSPLYITALYCVNDVFLKTRLCCKIPWCEPHFSIDSNVINRAMFLEKHFQFTVIMKMYFIKCHLKAIYLCIHLGAHMNLVHCRHFSFSIHVLHSEGTIVQVPLYSPGVRKLGSMGFEVSSHSLSSW
jgi:hypothetical protein